jgi:preprotein translocase subunit SecG
MGGLSRLTVIFTVCWATLALALGVLLARLGGLPESVPVFVSITGTPTVWAPTSIPMVTRIAFMGAGQLGVATALAYGSSRGGYADWTRLFGYMAIAVAGKTLAESISLAGTATAWGETTAPALHAITVLIVVAFLLSAIVMWRRGVLGRFPQITQLGTRVALVLSAGVWLVFATIPYWW